MIVKIIYNPYVKKSQIAYNGNEVENDSILNYICNKKIQNWFEITSEWQGVFAELKQKFRDEKLYLEFWGRMIDYKEFELNFQKYQSEQILLSEPILIEDENILMNEIASFINKLEQNDKLSCDLADEFEKINSNKFKICVIATMSSGKSTLINAMLGRDLLPSNTAACTATITTLTDNDEMEGFDVRCFDQTGKLFIEKSDVTLEELESYNENGEIKIIDLEGPIPGISTSRFNLHLIDTPGPNNSTNDDHEKLTFEMIESDDYAMVIYVMSPETIQSDDNDELLQMIAETMNKVGKKADERFLFVINKCDNLDPEDEDDTIENVLETAKAYLKKRGIDKPNIYPVTAEIAKLIRMKQRGEKLTRKDKNEIDDWLEIFESSTPEDKEYQRLKSFEEFASVTPQVRQTLAKRLKTAKTEKNVVTEGLIHTGVSALEESIEEYLAKSVYPTKISEFITCVDTYLKFPVLSEAIAHYFDEKLKLGKHGNAHYSDEKLKLKHFSKGVFNRVEYVLETGIDNYLEEINQINSIKQTMVDLQETPLFDCFKITECLVIRMINSNGLIVINQKYCNINPIGISNLKLVEMRNKGNKYFGSEGFKYKILKESELKNLVAKDFSRIIWMPQSLKMEIQNQLNSIVEIYEKIENFSQMISDEIIAKNAEDLLVFAQKNNHPIFLNCIKTEVRRENMEFRINYNPYELRSEFFWDGVRLTEDSRFSRIKEKRLQQWLNKNGDWNGLCNELLDLIDNASVEVKFKGRAVDYEDLRLYLQQECSKKISLSEPELSSNDQNIMEQLDMVIKDINSKGREVFTEDQFYSIQKSYENAKKADFKVCVIATMSSGKSTLINALLGRDLLPSNTAACTATITTIRDHEQMKSFDVKCLDKKGELVSERKEVTLEELEEFNADAAIKQIDLIGPIPGIESDKMTLFLVDTPGPNNSTNDDHEELTKEIINSGENTMVVYVMSPETIQSDDNNELLKSIAEVMQKNGKQAEDRFLFVINKCDDLDPEDEDDTVKNVIQTTKNYLIKKGIHYPNLFPVTAEIAKLIRMDKRDEKITRRDKKEISNWVDNFESDDPEDQVYQKLLSFEQFASLSPEGRENIKVRIEEARKNVDLESEALIHTGVPALEETVEEYLEKYAYPMKINDAVKDLIEIIDQEEMKNKFHKEMQEDTAFLEQVKRDIAKSRTKVNELKKKKTDIEEKIGSFKFDLNSSQVKNEIEKDLNKISAEYRGEVEIRKEASDRTFREFARKQEEYLVGLERKLSNQIETEIKAKGEEMLKEFRTFMDEFNNSIKIGNFDFGKIVEFKNCDSKDLNSLIKAHTKEKTHKETYYQDNPERSGFFGRLKFWKPEKIEKTRTVSDGEFVNVYKTVETAVTGWQTKLNEQIDQVFKQAENEVRRLNEYFKNNMDAAEKVVNTTLNEINDDINNNLNMKKQDKEKALEANQWKMSYIDSVSQQLKEILSF